MSSPCSCVVSPSWPLNTMERTIISGLCGIVDGPGGHGVVQVAICLALVAAQVAICAVQVASPMVQVVSSLGELATWLAQLGNMSSIFGRPRLLRLAMLVISEQGMSHLIVRVEPLSRSPVHHQASAFALNSVHAFIQVPIPSPRKVCVYSVTRCTLRFQCSFPTSPIPPEMSPCGWQATCKCWSQAITPAGRYAGPADGSISTRVEGQPPPRLSFSDCWLQLPQNCGTLRMQSFLCQIECLVVECLNWLLRLACRG